LNGQDTRTTLARGDLASTDLEGLVRAARYVEPTIGRVIRSSVPLRGSAAAGQVDQLLFGELFDQIACVDGQAWGQARRDGYVGFVDANALSSDLRPPTHRVGALRTIGFESPSIKSRAVGHLSLNSLVEVIEEDGSLVLAADFGWIPKRHLTPIGSFDTDVAAVAEWFVGAPYLWGGRDSLGLDCSGLVQQSLYACGLACPRDSDQQAMLGHEAAELALDRSDLVFWKGHVGMMLDGERLIHANGHHMAVVIEPLALAVARIESIEGRRPTAYRRL
jgi:cell wall-associated NlpC family hydrolase